MRNSSRLGGITCGSYCRDPRHLEPATWCAGAAGGNGHVAERVYWHRELPPADAQIMGEHTVEAESGRVLGTLAHRDELWDTCHADLMRRTVQRLDQEIARLGGHFAHVVSESIEPKHDGATSEAWLHGRFEYVLYRRPSSERPTTPSGIVGR